MPGARGKATKAARVEDTRDRPLRKGDREALGQPVAQIDATPAHHAVGGNIRSGFHPLFKLDKVLGPELRWPPGPRTIPEPVHAFGIVTMHPVAQSLPVHTRSPRRIRPAPTIQHQSNRQQKPRLRRISNPTSHLPQLRYRQIHPFQRHCQQRAPSPNSAEVNHIDQTLGIPDRESEVQSVGMTPPEEITP